MDGFDAGQVEIPAPPVEIAEGTRERLIRVVAAVVHGWTPEEVAKAIADGLPDDAVVGLERPGEREEMSAHVDLILGVLQSPDEASA